MLSMMVFCSVALAVELTNIEKVPSTYAKLVDDKDGKKVIEFGNDAIVYEPRVTQQDPRWLWAHPGVPREGPIDVREGRGRKRGRR